LGTLPDSTSQIATSEPKTPEDLIPNTAKMITRFITDVSTKFNPFSPRAKAARVFLSFLPPTARSDGMNITTKLLPRNSPEPSTLYVKFKDGKEMNIDCEKLHINSIVEEVDRHSRALQKQLDLDS